LNRINNKKSKALFIGPLKPKQRKQINNQTTPKVINTLVRALVGKAKPNKRGLRVASLRGVTGRSYVSQWKAAICNPFSTEARGVKNPDGFSFPTESRAIKARVTITGLNSNMALGLLPNPCLSMIDITLAGGSATSVLATSLSAYAANPQVYAGTTPTSMNSAYESFRVVSGGYKVRVQTPELSRTGTLICAPFIANRVVPGPNALINVALTSADAYSHMLGGINFTVANSAAILELPGAFEVSLADLGREDLILPFKPISTQSGVFHGASFGAGYSATYNESDSTLSTGAGAIYPSGNDMSDLTSCEGFCGWLLYADGYVSSNTPLFSLETVYHLEGVPVISTALGAVPVPDTAPPPVASAVEYAQAARDIGSMPWEAFTSIGLEAMGVAAAVRRGFSSRRQNGLVRY